MDGIVLTAAGASTRFGGDRPKVLERLAGRPLLLHAHDRLREALPAACLVVTAPAEHERRFAELLPTATVVEGGPTRQESVYFGIQALPPEVEVIGVHDAARPLVPVDVIREVFAMARTEGAAAAVVPVTDTLHRVSDKHVGGHLLLGRAVDRESVAAAQTPQAARAELMRRAYRRAAQRGLSATDEVGLLRDAHVDVVAVEGAREGLKITTRQDLAIAEALLARAAALAAEPETPA